MIGTRLGHYEFRERLGAGGMGEVYVARDTRLGRDVALKLFALEATDDLQRRQRLEQEARAIASLRHPNIVTLHSVEEDEGRLFLTMELVRGPRSWDALGSDDLMYNAALIHAVIGDVRHAVALLDTMTRQNALYTVHVFRLDCVWDPVRDHPEFEALMQRLASSSAEGARP